MGSIVIKTETQNRSHEEDQADAACLQAMQLANSYALPVVLNTAIELGIFDIISKADVSVSAADIVAHLPSNNPKAASVLDRMLHLLSSFNLLHSAKSPSPGAHRLYTLAPAGKYFVKGEDDKGWVATGMFAHYIPAMEKWYYMKDAVLEGVVPFEKAYGMPFFQYGKTDPMFNKVFNKAMSATTTLNMRRLLEVYKGFEGVKVLVDVGGGVGAVLNLIVSSYPAVKGVNFDLPQVINVAPSYPGIEHVGGDMFSSVPKADAIFMKSILHDWDDEECVKILKNCYEALEENGKVIVVSAVMPEEEETGLEAKYVTELDIMMLVNFGQGRERTENELKALAGAAGFQSFKRVCSAYANWVIELQK